MDYTERPQPYHRHKEWYDKRNKQVYKDREAGMTWRELEDKYGITETYLRKIYYREEAKHGGN